MTADEVMALIEASEKRFYCYILWRQDGTPFYVGAGQGKRILDHRIRDTRRGSKSTLIKRAIGAEPVYSVFRFFDTWEEAAAVECELIALFGRADLGTGLLANGTDGGDGIVGIKWELTEARKAGIRRAAEKERSTQTRAKMSESAKRRGSDPFIEGARRWREENMDELIKERQTRWDDPGYRERHVEAMADPALRTLMSKRMLDRLADPEKRAKLNAAITAAKGRPVSINGVTYPTLGAAGAALGLTGGGVRHRIKTGVPGYKWADKPHR